MNLIRFHFTEKKFDFISLKLLSSSVSSHLMKKNLILSHFIKKKISSHPDSDPGQNQTRMGNPGSCGQPSLAKLRACTKKLKTEYSYNK